MPNQIKILFLASNPSDTVRLRLDEEVRAIDRSLRAGKFRDRFELIQHWAVRPGDLQEIFLRREPNIVHFSGHGSETGQIVLENEQGNSQVVAPTALSELFSLFSDSIRCVVLNACYSYEQAQAIAQHVDCVVGMSAAIDDKSAESFALAFYQALAYGKSVKSAFELGRLQIDLENLPEPDAPKLVTIKGDPERVTFVDAEKAISSDTVAWRTETMTTFDQRNQQVGTQYNVAGDINFASLRDQVQTADALESLQSEVRRAIESQVFDEDTATDLDYLVTKAVQQARKPRPDKDAIVANLRNARNLASRAGNAGGLVATIEQATQAVERLF